MLKSKLKSFFIWQLNYQSFVYQQSVEFSLFNDSQKMTKKLCSVMTQEDKYLKLTTKSGLQNMNFLVP